MNRVERNEVETNGVETNGVEMNEVEMNEVERIALTHPEAKSIEKLRLRKLGFDMYMDFHLRVPSNLTVEKGHQVSHEVKNELLTLHPYLRDILIHLEPANE